MPLPYDRETSEAFFTAFLQTPLGERLDREGLLHNANTVQLVNAAQTVYGHLDITVREFATCAKQASLNGDLQPEQAPAPEPEPAPKPLTPSQEAWREHRIFTETHSAKDCEARSRVDRSYAAYLHKLRVGEFEASEVGDAVVNLNEKKPLAKGNIPEGVATFADDYRHMSVAQAKSLMSPGVAGEAVAAHYQKLFVAACEAGLI